MPWSVPAMNPPLARGASDPTRNGVSHSVELAVVGQPEDLPALDVDPVERGLARDPHRPFAEHGVDVGDALDGRVGSHRAAG